MVWWTVVDGIEEDADSVTAAAGDRACACLGEKAVADGAAELGWLVADELTSIGELAFVDKMLGDNATGGISNIIGSSTAWVLKAGLDMASVCAAETAVMV